MPETTNTTQIAQPARKFEVFHYPDGSMVSPAVHPGKFVAVLPDEHILRGPHNRIDYFDSKEDAEEALAEYGHGPRPWPSQQGLFGYGQCPHPNDPFLKDFLAKIQDFRDNYHDGAHGWWDEDDDNEGDENVAVKEEAPASAPAVKEEEPAPAPAPAPAQVKSLPASGDKDVYQKARERFRRLLEGGQS